MNRSLGRSELPAKPGFARRKPHSRALSTDKKEGVHGGTMGSPMREEMERGMTHA
jgi:hypothetical protein